VGDREVTSVRAAIAAWAEREPAAAAVVAPGRAPLGFGRLGQHIDDTIAHLRAMGIRRGDRVALALPQGPEAATAFLAIAAGAVCAPINPALRERELSRDLTDLGVRAMVVPAPADSTPASVARSLDIDVIGLAVEPADPAGLFGLQPVPAPVAPADDEPARSGDVALLLQTSGTTSRPKRVPLTHANILASAGFIGETLALTPHDRCLDLMPLFHVHGLIAGLAALVAGGSVLAVPAFDVSRVFAWIDECRPTWITGVPAFYAAMVSEVSQHGAILARSPLRLVRSASAPLPVRLMRALEEAFAVPVIEAYGMTEAATVTTSNPIPPGTRKPGSAGRAAGPEIAVLDGAGRPLPAGQEGQIALRGDNVTHGYDGDVEATARAFRGGWFHTGDLGHLDEDGYLFITGRVKEIINRGGEKVAPREVEEALLQHPGIADAAVFPLPHPTLGEDVGAAVVLRPGAGVTAADIRHWARERLADFKAPRRIALVSELPRGSTGKVARAVLARQLGLDTAPRDGIAAEPSTPTQAALAAIWAEVLEVGVVGADDDFFALGGDSIRAMRVVARVRERLGRDLSATTVLEQPTLAALAATLDAEGPAPIGALPEAMPSTSDVSPLSFGQERLWLAEQLDPGRPRYNVPLAFRLIGPLDVAALGRSLEAIVARHDALRATFLVAGDSPMQRIGPIAPPYLEVRDIRGGGDVPADERGRTVLEAEARRPFDLRRGPLIRCLLVRVADAEHLLLITIHHIAFDDWSRHVFLRELAACHAAFSTGGVPALPALPWHHRDHADWQRQRLAGARLEAGLDWWRRRLAGAPVSIELPTDRPRPSAGTGRGARACVSIPPSLLEELRTVGHGARVTPFMTLLASVATLLHRYSGQEDLLVGTYVSDRGRVEAEPLVGFFLNALILRVDCSGDPTFLELLARVRNVALDAYAHQDIPFERVVQTVRPERAAGRVPLVQVVLNYQGGRRGTLDLPGIGVQPLPIETGMAKFDLSITVAGGMAGLDVDVEYDLDLFDPATVERMLGRWDTLLRSVVADPGRRLSCLPLATAAERDRIARDWKDGLAARPATCVHTLVQAQARRTPDAVAVVCADRTLGYAELDDQARRLASRLQAMGVAPGARVGVCLDRSPELIVTLLAVLTAGAAYVPLDSAYPIARLRLMIEDAAPAVTLTQARLLPRLGGHGGPTLCLDGDAGDGSILRQPAAPAVGPDDLAYVIYTSGSTGRPKGVMTTHRAVVNYLHYLIDTYRLGPGDAVLQLTSCSFDPSVREIFGALASGARLVLLPGDGTADPHAVLDRIRRHGVTRIVGIVPTMVRALAAAAETDGPAVSVRTVLVSGETLTAADCRAAALFAPGAALVNQYGPTETTMTATWHPVAAADLERALIPVGRPIPGMRVCVVDSALAPVPSDIPGEICIGGVGVSRGYLGQPELTADRFVPDPFVRDPDARMFRTGDRGRLRAHGVLEVLGRLDRQIKVQGVRVEPGEIEALLCEHPDVSETVVALRDHGAGAPRLVAYVVARTARATDPAALRRFLRARLPSPMVPADIVGVHALPLLPNGKVDVDRLPVPAGREPSRRLTPPRTGLERELEARWTDLLGVTRVGVDEDFFALGGHSLLAARLLSRIRARYGVDLPLRSFVDAPTIESLAVAITETLASRTEAAALSEVLREIETLGEDGARRRLDEAGA
jgi:amino acid adenylation domain-containing protein